MSTDGGAGKTRTVKAAFLPTLVSQAASALSNILLLVAAGRSADPMAIGTVATAGILYQVELGVCRAVIGEVCLVRSTFVGGLDARGAARASLMVGVVGALPLLAIGLGYEPLRCLVVLGLAMPALLLQDTLRYTAFATRTPRTAATADSIWLTVALLMAIIAPRVGGGAQVVVAIWAMGAVVGLPVLFRRTPHQGRSGALEWMVSSWPIGRSYLPDQLLLTASASIPPLAVGLLDSDTAMGHLRLALAALGPVTVAWAAVSNAAVPRLVTKPKHSLSIEVLLSAGTMAAVAGWSAIGYSIPEAWGTAIAGPAWAGARSWIVPVAMVYTAFASWSGAVVGLKVHGHPARLVRVRAAATPLLVGSPIVGFGMAGNHGYGWGGCFAGTVAGIFLWRGLLRAVGDEASPGERSGTGLIDTTEPCENARDREG